MLTKIYTIAEAQFSEDFWLVWFNVKDEENFRK